MLKTAKEDVMESSVSPCVGKRMKILVVDDDRVIRELLRGLFEKDGYEIRLAASGEQALQILKEETFPVILSDIHMIEVDGLALLAQLNKTSAGAVVILMTGYGSLDGAIEAIHQGAFDYISKPFRPDDLRTVVQRAMHHWEAKNSRPPATGVSQVPLTATRGLIGKSPKIVRVYKTLARATMAASNILIVGESGTGKELVAKAIHENSPRRTRPFITVNCGALTETLLESELFGHIKGSFTGAIANKRGLFDEADGGTMFLDEIGDITPALQVKLLRAIQEGEFKPVGSTEIRKVDTRVIAATHRDLELYVREGKFREDLYYRLKVILIELPPLRERIDDLPELTSYFLSRYAKKNVKQVSYISNEAMQLLYQYPWPGNIRELEHAIERALAMTSTTILYAEDFPPEIVNYRKRVIPKEETEAAPTGEAEKVVAAPIPEPVVSKSLEQMERTHIVRILQEVGFNKSKAADILGIDRATLYRKAQRYGIRLAEEKPHL